MKRDISNVVLYMVHFGRLGNEDLNQIYIFFVLSIFRSGMDCFEVVSIVNFNLCYRFAITLQ